MHVAEDFRASEQTVFFIVSVARTLLLSPAVKHDSKSPCNNTCTVHSQKSFRSGCRFTRTSRTRDFPYRFSARTVKFSASSICRVPVRAQQQGNVNLLFALVQLKSNL